ncbi:hypothetical protein [Photobacterium toruni]
MSPHTNITANAAHFVGKLVDGVFLPLWLAFAFIGAGFGERPRFT